MRVKVSEIDNGHASTGVAGLRLYHLIKPVLDKGEEVVLDFEQVKHCAAPFLSASVGNLIEEDKEERLPRLLRYENLTPQWQRTVDGVKDRAVRRRENPRWAAGWDEAYRKLFGGDWG